MRRAVRLQRLEIGVEVARHDRAQKMDEVRHKSLAVERIGVADREVRVHLVLRQPDEVGRLLFQLLARRLFDRVTRLALSTGERPLQHVPPLVPVVHTGLDQDQGDLGPTPGFVAVRLHNADPSPSIGGKLLNSVIGSHIV